MKPSSVIAVLACMASFSAASAFFLDDALTAAHAKTFYRPAQTTLWGEGSEATAADTALKAPYN